MSKTIYSIGHGAKTIEVFLSQLKEAKIDVLVDVRHFPGSRKHPHFGQDALKQSVESNGIRYVHLVDLGGRRHLKKADECKCKHTALRVKAFKGYAEHMTTLAFEKAYEELCTLAKRVAYMCSETVWWKCHRRMISDRLLADGWTVLHLGVSKDKNQHQLWPCARVVLTPTKGKSKSLIYDQKTEPSKSRKRKLNQVEITNSTFYQIYKRTQRMSSRTRMLKPIWMTDHWEWDGLTVKPSKQSEHAGLGLFATRLLECNTVIPYHGQVIDEKEFQKRDQMGKATHIAYSKKGVYIDAHPSVSKKAPWMGIGECGLWIAGTINEGSISPPNCRLALYRGNPRFITKQVIYPGEELLANYGKSYRRNYQLWSSRARERKKMEEKKKKI